MQIEFRPVTTEDTVDPTTVGEIVSELTVRFHCATHDGRHDEIERLAGILGGLLAAVDEIKKPA